VFGYVGNHGRRRRRIALHVCAGIDWALFFGPLTGANVVRNDPPDPVRLSITGQAIRKRPYAAVRYLVKIRKLQPRQIAGSRRTISFGDAGFAGVAKAFRALGISDGTILRLNYTRNTVDVDDDRQSAPDAEGADPGRVRHGSDDAAGSQVSSRRPATCSLGLIYTNMSSVGASSLAERIGLLLGPSGLPTGVIVTQSGSRGGRLFERGDRVQGPRSRKVFPRR